MPRWTLGAVVLLVVGFVGVLGWRVEQHLTRDTAHRFVRSVEAHDSCASVVLTVKPRGPRGAERTGVPTTARRATAISSIECNNLGGFADVLTFASARARDAALHADAELERSKSCRVGRRELIVDGDLGAVFRRACHDAGGQVVEPTHKRCPIGPDRPMVTIASLDYTPAEERRFERERHGGPCAFPRRHH